MASHAGPVFKYFIIDLAGSVIRFPVWWYTTGFRAVVGWVTRSLSYRWKSYAFGIWARNFFVPMYGQHDVTGRLVSVFMRFVVLVGRLIAFGAETFAYLVLATVWVLAPAAFLLLFLSNFYQGAFLGSISSVIPYGR
jgi:hypothetical protein